MTDETNLDRSLVLQVVAATVAFEGIQLPDGRIMTVALAEPRQRWAVLATSTERGIDVLAMTDTEAEGIETAQYVERRLRGADGPVLAVANDRGTLQ